MPTDRLPTPARTRPGAPLAALAALLGLTAWARPRTPTPEPHVRGSAVPAFAQADSNRAFLRAMADHHAGLLAIVDAAMPRITDTPKKDARPLRARQAAEQQQMLALLRAAYADSAPARADAPARAMADSVRKATFGGQAARAFYRQVVHHHRAGAAIAERLLPHLTGDVRAMAERMLETERAETERFRRLGSVQ